MSTHMGGGMDKWRFKSEVDGLSIQAYRWRCAVSRPKQVVIIAHGACEHVMRYQRFARVLNAHGIEVLGLDHRGHGESLTELGPMDFGSGGWDGLVEDLRTFISKAKTDYPGIPCVLFGHSMGSFAAQQYCLQSSQDIDALILSGSTALQIQPEELA